MRNGTNPAAGLAGNDVSRQVIRAPSGVDRDIARTAPGS